LPRWKGFTRDDVDAFALESQKRATAAQAAGYFDRSVVPVKDGLGQTILDATSSSSPTPRWRAWPAQAGLRADGRMGFDQVALTRYPQVERIHHVHHAGNSSGIVDGAAAVLIGNEAAAKAHGLTPRARIVATALSAPTRPSC
jgi:acetyl-CoA C-acetyltransferase